MQENVFSETPLHAACTNGRNLELVAFLLKQPGVDANFQGQDGHTGRCTFLNIHRKFFSSFQIYSKKIFF